MQDLHAEIYVDPESGDHQLAVTHAGEIMFTTYIDNDYGITDEVAKDFVNFLNSKNKAIMDERDRAKTIVYNYKKCDLYTNNKEQTPVSIACDNILKRLHDGNQEETI